MFARSLRPLLAAMAIAPLVTGCGSRNTPLQSEFAFGQHIVKIKGKNISKSEQELLSQIPHQIETALDTLPTSKHSIAYIKKSGFTLHFITTLDSETSPLVKKEGDAVYVVDYTTFKTLLDSSAANTSEEASPMSAVEKATILILPTIIADVSRTLDRQALSARGGSESDVATFEFFTLAQAERLHAQELLSRQYVRNSDEEKNHFARGGIRLSGNGFISGSTSPNAYVIPYWVVGNYTSTANRGWKNPNVFEHIATMNEAFAWPLLFDKSQKNPVQSRVGNQDAHKLAIACGLSSASDHNDEAVATASIAYLQERKKSIMADRACLIEQIYRDDLKRFSEELTPSSNPEECAEALYRLSLIYLNLLGENSKPIDQATQQIYSIVATGGLKKIDTELQNTSKNRYQNSIMASECLEILESIIFVGEKVGQLETVQHHGKSLRTCVVDRAKKLSAFLEDAIKNLPHRIDEYSSIIDFADRSVDGAQPLKDFANKFPELKKSFEFQKFLVQENRRQGLITQLKQSHRLDASISVESILSKTCPSLAKVYKSLSANGKANLDSHIYENTYQVEGKLDGHFYRILKKMGEPDVSEGLRKEVFIEYVEALRYDYENLNFTSIQSNLISAIDSKLHYVLPQENNLTTLEQELIYHTISSRPANVKIARFLLSGDALIALQKVQKELPHLASVEGPRALRKMVNWKYVQERLKAREDY